jgi:hypothetical protein
LSFQLLIVHTCFGFNMCFSFITVAEMGYVDCIELLDLQEYNTLMYLV